jgi:cytochrome c oxidase subunit II
MRRRFTISLIAGVAAAALVVSVFAACAIAGDAKQVIQISAKKFEYTPNTIILKKGVPVVLELTSSDSMHGFNCPGLGIRSDIEPNKVNRLEFVPDNVGSFPFHCDNFCGSGHDRMTGTIVVNE